MPPSVGNPWGEEFSGLGHTKLVPQPTSKIGVYVAGRQLVAKDRFPSTSATSKTRKCGSQCAKHRAHHPHQSTLEVPAPWGSVQASSTKYRIPGAKAAKVTK